MKENEIREAAKCIGCEKGFMHTGLPTFWRVTIKRYGVDMKAVKRQQGLTMMLDGHAPLARVMGPNETLAEPIMETVEITLCEFCAAANPIYIAATSIEILQNAEEEKK